MSELSDLLTSLPVPDHRASFWEELEARLAVVDTERSAESGIGRAGVIDANSAEHDMDVGAVLEVGSGAQRSAHL